MLSRGVSSIRTFSGASRAVMTTRKATSTLCRGEARDRRIDMLRAEKHLAPLIGRPVGIISRCGLTRERHDEILRDMVQVF